MKQDVIDEVTKTLQNKYPEVGIQSIEVDKSTGKSTFYVEPTEKSLAFIDLNKGGGVTPRIANKRAQASIINRDFVQRTNLDLAAGDPYTEDPKESFKRATRYYYVDPLVGSATNLLAALARKGFENDIDDENIKQFYDVWTFDVRFDEILEWIFLDFFKIGHVTTYKVLSKYEPRVSYLSPVPGQKLKTNKTKGKESAAKKNIWSKGHLPVAYTVLNPALVDISGNLMFDKVSTSITPPPELRELIKKPTAEQTEEEKELLKALPPDLKRAAEKGGSYQLDSRLVGSITYRKQPYEKYAKPRTTRIFDSIEYKKSLREADLSTLDGISNYILKITVGNDEYPVVTQDQLEAVSQLFNTPSKSFDVVWNHTLEIEKIVSPEIDKILGQGKYEQVNDDLTTGLAVSRALLDGGSGMNAAEVDLLIKGLTEEIRYARRQVTRWIYREYQQIAEAMSFERFPKIRWDEGILLDTILYMNTLAQCVDRRMLSYRTSLEALGFDYPNELRNMEEELPLVTEGTFGILGSPFQKSAESGPVPTGTPSSGPPKGQVKNKSTKPKTVKKSAVSPNQQKKNKLVKQAASFDYEVIKNMAPSEYAVFLDGAKSVLIQEEFVNFLDEIGKIRYGK